MTHQHIALLIFVGIFLFVSGVFAGMCEASDSTEVGSAIFCATIIAVALPGLAIGFMW